MAVAIIIAGGSGSRMGQDIPKQFINVYDKPVLIYTLDGFQKHPMIDAIEVVCLDGWHDVLRAYARQFGITKLKWVVSGGKTGQESIRNGVYNMEGKDLNRLKVVLAEKKRTNKWLAEQIGVDQATVSKWCTNSAQPNLENLMEVAKCLEVNVNELLRM